MLIYQFHCCFPKVQLNFRTSLYVYLLPWLTEFINNVEKSWKSEAMSLYLSWNLSNIYASFFSVQLLLFDIIRDLFKYVLTNYTILAYTGMSLMYWSITVCSILKFPQHTCFNPVLISVTIHA